MKRTLNPAAPLLALAMLSLLAALWAGLIRMGWSWPPLRPLLPMAHGPLMVGGFLGTLISLERAVGLGAIHKGLRWPFFLAPLAAGLGSALLLVGVGGVAGPLLVTLGSLGLAASMARIYRLQPAFYSAVLLAGAMVFLFGNLLWLGGRAVAEVVLWWQVFVVLTIAGERLELSRLLRPSRRVQAAFVLITLALLAACLLSLFSLGAGVRLAGLGMAALAVWLLGFDIAWRRLRAGGQARFIALALIAGYIWLAVGGLLMLRFGGMTAGLQYDAMLHAVFVGFVFSMIFGHALIIFPAVLGRPLVYRPLFYLPLALLHLSLALRIVGDLALQMTVRRWGGILNATAILVFMALVVASVLRGGAKER